jgi:hypothetical protein
MNPIAESEQANIFQTCEPWSLTLRDKHRLRVFENRALKFGSKKDEVTGEWRRLHSEDPYDLYSS